MIQQLSITIFLCILSFAMGVLWFEANKVQERLEKLQNNIAIAKNLAEDVHEKLKNTQTKHKEVRKQFERVKADNPEPGNELIPHDRLLILQQGIQRANASIPKSRTH